MSSTPTTPPAKALPWPPPFGTTASTYASPSSRSSPSSSSQHAPSASPTPTPGVAPSGPPSCAACKHQRRRCTPDCVLAPYFPASQPDKFREARRLFGVKNMLHILKAAGPARRDACMRTILYESEVRRRDPVRGCRGVVRDLENQLRDAFVELDAVQQQIALRRGTAATLELMHPPPANDHNPRGAGGAASPTETTSSLDVARQQQQVTNTSLQASTPEMQPTELTVATQPLQQPTTAQPGRMAMPWQTLSDTWQLADTSQPPTMFDDDIVTTTSPGAL